MATAGQGFTAAAQAFEITRRLSAFDAQFLAAESETMPCHYMGIATFAPDAEGRPLTVARVKAHLASRIDRVPPLRLRIRSVPLGLDHPWAVDGPVDLDEHVIAGTVRAPGGPRELALAAEEIMRGTMDRSRPLWEFHVLEGLADGHVAVGMKFHHACADALGASAAMAFILDPTADGERPLPERVAVEAVPDVRRLAFRGALRSVSHPVRMARAAANAVPHLDQVPMMRTLPGARIAARGSRALQRRLGQAAEEPKDFPRAPETRFNGPLTPHRRIAFGHVDLDAVRSLRLAHGVSFNDVVVGAVAGGLRRRLLAGDELPDDPLLAFVPANVRTGDAATKGGNAISSFVVPIPTDCAGGPERLQRASVAMQRAKERHALTPPTLMEDANALVPSVVFGPFAAGIMKLLGSGRVALPLNLLLSNVPGPPVPMFLDGAPMRTFRPMSLVFPGAALNITVISYDRRLEIGVIGDRELVPDAWALLEDIEAEFAALVAAAGD